MKIASFLILALIVGGAVFFLNEPQVIEIKKSSVELSEAAATTTPTIPATLPEVGNEPNVLRDPPVMVRGEYMSGWSAGLRRRMDPFMEKASSSGLNAVVIDVKDSTGYVSYKMDVPEVIAAHADREVRMADIDSLIRDLHAKNIYVIARVAVFEDTIFAKAHPELAIKDKRTGELWRDRKNLAWLDPAGQKTWDYAIAIANEAYSRGFDEVNFDYIRFPSDGNLDNAVYPFWDKTKPREEVMREFFSYLRRSLAGRKISADLFGLVTVAEDDMGIGQVMEDALPYFDYIAPMVYPSHFAKGFEGYKNPAEVPYEVIKFSMEKALLKRQNLASSSVSELAKYRPWLQAFDLGAVYTPQMINAQIRALNDVFASDPEAYAGWLLWDPANEYKNFRLTPELMPN